MNHNVNPNSSNVWLAPIIAAGLPVPKTIVVPYVHHDILPLFDGNYCAAFNRLRDEVEVAARAVGFPVFIRTDLASAKHSGPTAYLAASASDLEEVLFKTIEDNELKFWPTSREEEPSAILVREYLNLEHHFTAFRGLPISREWRLFATPEKVICAHPYWPAEALEEHVDEAAYPDWEFWLQQLHEPMDMAELERMAKIAAGAAGSPFAWSVDFCRDVTGKWWLLDMATMADSFHWSECPNGGGM